MTKPEVMELLARWPYMEERINRLNEEKTRLEELVKVTRDIKATVISGMPGNRMSISDPTFRSVELIIDKYESDLKRMERRLKERETESEHLKSMLKELEKNEQAVITMRHLKRRKWLDIMNFVALKRTRCYCLEQSAIQKMMVFKEALNKFP